MISCLKLNSSLQNPQFTFPTSKSIDLSFCMSANKTEPVRGLAHLDVTTKGLGIFLSLGVRTSLFSFVKLFGMGGTRTNM